MTNIVKEAKEEASRLEKMIRKIDLFLTDAPDGCLKWQNRNGRESI